MPVLIAEIWPSEAVVRKINSKHGLTLDDVWHACEYREKAVWHKDAERGTRLLVRGPALNQDRVRLVLYPVDIAKGVWNLGTAFRE